MLTILHDGDDDDGGDDDGGDVGDDNCKIIDNDRDGDDGYHKSIHLKFQQC